MNTIKLENILKTLENKYQKSYEEYLFIDLIEALLEKNTIEVLEFEDIGKTESST